MRRLAILGLMLVIVGAVLAVAFWPLASVSGAKLLSGESGNSWALGSRVFVHEKILKAAYPRVLVGNWTAVELEDGDPSTGTYVLVKGDARPFISLGSFHYFTATRATFGLGVYWEVSSPSDIKPSLPVDAAFDATLGIGLLLIVVTFRKPEKEE